MRITYLCDNKHPYPIGDGDHGLIKTEDYLDNGIPYIRVQNLGYGTELDISSIVYISEANNEKIKNSTLAPNDILFAKTGATIGKTGIVPVDMPIANTTSHVGKLTVAPEFCAKYVFYVLSSFVGYRQFWQIACQKTTRPELGINELKFIIIPIPRLKETQERIVDFLDEKSSQVDALVSIKQSKINKLNAYKKSLVYEHVTGKKEV